MVGHHPDEVPRRLEGIDIAEGSRRDPPADVAAEKFVQLLHP
jgi:hypothetical protein